MDAWDLPQSFNQVRRNFVGHFHAFLAFLRFQKTKSRVQPMDAGHIEATGFEFVGRRCWLPIDTAGRASAAQTKWPDLVGDSGRRI